MENILPQTFPLFRDKMKAKPFRLIRLIRLSNISLLNWTANLSVSKDLFITYVYSVGQCIELLIVKATPLVNCILTMPGPY